MNASAPDTAAASPSAHADRGQYLARLLPEIVACATALALALGLLPEGLAGSVRRMLDGIVAFEAVTLMFLCILVDVATRLRRAPPWWLGLLGCGALLVLYPEVPGLLIGALHEGLWVALPFAWSMIERLRELWTLPGSPRIEKLRRRALIFGRLFSGLVVAGTFVLAWLLESIVSDAGGRVQGLAPWFVAAYFALAACDAWRVHRPAFAIRPRNLWPWFDGGQTERMDPI